MTIAPSRNAAVSITAIVILSSCSLLPGNNPFLDQTPRAIAKTAFAEMQDVTSLRLLGSTDTNAGPMRVDFLIDDTSCIGSVDSNDGGIRIIKNSDGAWLKADNEYWRSQASSPRQAQALLATLSGAWVAIEKKNDLAKLCDLDALLEGFTLDTGDTEEQIEAGESEKIGDADAIAINGRDGKELTTVWVAVEAPHHVIKMAPTDDVGTPEAIYFEDFGIDVVAESPKKKDIVTLPGN